MPPAAPRGRRPSRRRGAPGRRGSSRGRSRRRRVEVGVLPQVLDQALGLLAQGFLAFGRDRQRQERQRGSGLLLGDARRLHCQRRLLQDHVRVGAADPEGGDTGATRALAPLPGLGLGQQLDRARVPIDVRGRLVDVQRLRQHPCAQRHRHLDHAGDAGRRLGVADVGLDRAQPQRLLPLLAVGGEQRARLDRVAERGAGAVRLDRVDLARLEPGVGQRLADHPLLRGAVRRGQPVRGAVLVDRRAADRWPAPGGRCGWASESRSSTSRPTPSEQPVPSAPAAKALQRPSGASPRWRLNSMNWPRRRHHGDARRPAPASTRPARSAWQARCIATSEEEQAVSTVTAGPSRPSA